MIISDVSSKVSKEYGYQIQQLKVALNPPAIGEISYLNHRPVYGPGSFWFISCTLCTIVKLFNWKLKIWFIKTPLELFPLSIEPKDFLLCSAYFFSNSILKTCSKFSVSSLVLKTELLILVWWVKELPYFSSFTWDVGLRLRSWKCKQSNRTI